VNKWSRERKDETQEETTEKVKKPKTTGSLKLKGMVMKGHGKQSQFEKSSATRAKIGSYEEQLDKRCKGQSDKFCA